MPYLFEDFALDADRRELRQGDRLLPVEPKVFDLLLHLITNREHVVSKDALIAAVWDGRIVSDSALTTCINAARAAISDSGEQQRLIKTLPRKGFRFMGTLLTEKEHAKPVVGSPLSLLGPDLALPDKPSIAVLPFANLSSDPEQEYFSDGITEDIITELSRFSELFVIARNSSFQYKGKSPDIRLVGRELGVRYVLEGSIRRDGSRVRVTAQLIEAATGSHKWADRYDRELQDVFAVQDEVARKIAGVLAAHVNKAEVERTILKPPAVWEAYDYYMRGSDIYTMFLSSYSALLLYEARALFEKSLSADPRYARACAALAASYVDAAVNPLDSDYRSAAALQRAYEFACRAVRLDASLPQAHASLGRVLVWKYEHDAAIVEFQRALELNPNFTDWRLSAALTMAGDHLRAIDAAQAHIKRDPFYTVSTSLYMGLAFYMQKRYAEAVISLRECVTKAPNLRGGHSALAATYAQLGQFARASVEVAEVLRLEPGYKVDPTIIPFKHSADIEHYMDGLRKAGLPERLDGPCVD